MIKHVWFDVGGTLYPESPEFDSVHDALRYKTYAEIVGEHDPLRAKEAYDALYSEHGSNSAVFSSLGKPSDFWQQVFEGIDLTDLIAPDALAQSALKELSQLIPVSLFSNFKPEKIAQVLELLDIPRTYFTHILSGDDITKRKPDLEGFRKMVDLSAIPANQILYVGDRVKVDIIPAKRIGMQTCLIWQSSSEADYSAVDYAELLSTVKQSAAI